MNYELGGSASSRVAFFGEADGGVHIAGEITRVEMGPEHPGALAIAKRPLEELRAHILARGS